VTRERRWRPTIRQTIGVVLAFMILLTAATLTTTSYLTTRGTLLGFARDLIRQNAEVVREQVEGFLRPARSSSELTLALVESGMVSVDDSRSVERYFYELLSVQPTVEMLNWGDEQGNFIMVKRQPNGSLSTKIISIGDDGARRTVWRHRDPGGALEPPREEVEDPADQYDPREREWYRGAVESGTVYWTGVYVFHSDKMPGVTAGAPRYDRDGRLLGVLSVDIGLVQMSHFLRERIRVGESGQAFLLDEKGRLIAVKDVEQLTVPDENGGGATRLRRIEESPVPEIAALARQRGSAEFMQQAFTAGRGSQIEAHTARYHAGGRDFVATLIPIQVGENRSWLAGVVAQEDEFLATAKQANVRALFTAIGFAVIALIIGILLARMIARSLNVLVSESARVRNMEIDSAGTRSRFRELDEVLTAFEGMKSGLRAFGKYVPVKLVRSLIEQDKEATLGGEPRTLTIFFSDIRDFSHISEGLHPTELAESLAVYLSTVTRRIAARQGTVDKYIGDAVMAFWGAPQDVPEHALQACLAASEALSEVRELRDHDPTLPDFYTRIGIHTAEVVVGNFGSEDRLSYTIIGDGVNLASRLEGINKHFGTQILISEATHALVEDRFVTRRIGLIAVKGREQVCVTYELFGPLGCADDTLEQVIRHYERALDQYLAREWTAAIAELELALALRGDDGPSRVLLELAQRHAADPPGKGWTGVISIETK
jgi:adenylate cyclase